MPFWREGSGEGEWKNYFSTSLTNVLGGLASLPTLGFGLAAHTQVWASSLTRSSPGPSCFKERKAGQSGPLTSEIPPMAWRASMSVGGTNPSSWSTATRNICFYVFCPKTATRPKPSHPAQLLNSEGEIQKGNSYRVMSWICRGPGCDFREHTE